MKLLHKISSATSYNLGFLILKISGYVFYSVKDSGRGTKFRQSFFDHMIFLTSLTFSLYLYFVGDGLNSSFKIRSTILLFGMVLMYKFAMFSIIFLKIINYVGVKKAFRILKSFETIDKKVWKYKNWKIKYLPSLSRWNQPTSVIILENCLLTSF